MLSLRFDLRLAPQSPASMADLYAASLDMSQWGESAGATTVMFSEHHASPDGYLPSPMVMAAATAARTSTIPITVAAVLLLMYDPVKLAEDMAVLDHLSRGRVNYIVGLGYRNEEYAMFGVDPSRRGELMEEYLSVLKSAFAGEPFSWRGREIHLSPQPVTAGGPTLAYGGGTHAAARRAARYGMMFIPQNNDSSLTQAYDEQARQVGNPTGLYMVLPDGYPMNLFVAADLDKAWESIGPFLLHDAMMYAQWLDAGGSNTPSYSGAMSIEQLRAQKGSYQIVTPNEAVEIARRFGNLALHPLCGGIPPDLAWESLRLIEDEVLPELKRNQA